MTPSRLTADEQLRRYALDNLRACVRRLKDGDGLVRAEGLEWRANQLAAAAKWAAVVDALNTPSPAVVSGS